MIEKKVKTVFEYIYGKDRTRSKTRVINVNHSRPFGITDVPEWNYDGSSTGQAGSDGDTERILEPVMLYKDPFYRDDKHFLVLCNNEKRKEALKIFEQCLELEPWFGLEQEYFMFKRNDPTYNHKWRKNFALSYNDGTHYCGHVRTDYERVIAEQHMQMCIDADIKISGINAEVENNQWEFQIGPCEGINAADDLIVARYLLERIAERYNVAICYLPKPFKDMNGSGCHINFSTAETRCENCIETINKYIERLEKKHPEHISVYGKDNDKRLTGLNETSSIDSFTWGVGTRNTSIRIPNSVNNAKCGYFEDRRPAANIDPYLATSKLFETCCLD